MSNTNNCVILEQRVVCMQRQTIGEVNKTIYYFSA